MHPAQATCLACAVKNLAPRLGKNCYHSLVSFPMRWVYMYFPSSLVVPLLLCMHSNSVSKGCAGHVVLLKHLLQVIDDEIYTRIFPLPRVLLREEQVFYNTRDLVKQNPKLPIPVACNSGPHPRPPKNQIAPYNLHAMLVGNKKN